MTQTQAPNYAKCGRDDANRFEFGKNWKQFLSRLNDERVGEAVASMKKMLGTESLEGASFIDIGSGSGLSSLAARKLGARVSSFDYDAQAVECTSELRRRFFPDDPQWTVQQGSALDAGFLRSLGRFDVVYSWGVLHHTGNMWQALENVAPLVADRGTLFVSIYNDQGRTSKFWAFLKKLYNQLPRPLRFPIVLYVLVHDWHRRVIWDLVRLRPFATWRAYGKRRGMSAMTDVIDWAGGYPFEVAKPEEIFQFYKERGFVLDRMTTVGGGVGCNEFVFHKE